MAYSKHRREIGLVGIEVPDITTQLPVARVGLARQWDATDVNRIISDVTGLYHRHRWDYTYLEQATGEYLIANLKANRVPVRAINSQKKIKDAKEIQKIRTMDTIEMTEFLRQLMKNGQIRFSTRPGPTMMILEDEIASFSKHTTEAGSVDYYAPGEEADDMVKALEITCFSVRNLLAPDIYGDTPTVIPLLGSPRQRADSAAESANIDIEAEMAYLQGDSPDGSSRGGVWF